MPALPRPRQGGRSLSLVELGARLQGGGARSPRSCVDGAKPAARYALSAAEKEALQAFLAGGGLAARPRRASHPGRAGRAGARLLGCHGVVRGVPLLDAVGAKLRPEWSGAFLAGRIPYKPRPPAHGDGQPWLAARMPAFASRAALLAEGLAAAQGYGPRSPEEPPLDCTAARLGARLLSASGGSRA